MALKYNPLLPGKLDQVGEGVDKLGELEDVSTQGTVDGYVLSYETLSGSWKPVSPAVGDMLKSDYVTGQGTVYNASRLEGETLATVQAHGVDAGTITQGTIGLARIPILPTDRYGSAVLVSGERTLTANLNFGSHEAANMQLEQLGSHPAAARARIYYDTAVDKVYVYIGTV